MVFVFSLLGLLCYVFLFSRSWFIIWHFCAIKKMATTIIVIVIEMQTLIQLNILSLHLSVYIVVLLTVTLGCGHFVPPKWFFLWSLARNTCSVQALQEALPSYWQFLFPQLFMTLYLVWDLIYPFQKLASWMNLWSGNFPW